MPDIGKLLAPRSVAVIGASSDTHHLRGRILEIMLGHPFAGPIHPVSRSAAEVQGRKAYPSVADLPGPVDLAVVIIPARYVPEELERCGRAGIRAAAILSSGFAEETGAAGAALQEQIRAVALRYDMAVSGPNSEGFANTAAALAPTFSPAVEAGARPLLPEQGRARGQLAVVAQSGGMGFAFFDRGRPKELSFRYIVTTGNEACLDTFDFVDWMLDEGKTDAFLLLLEDVKRPDAFRRVAEKALRAGKPLIVGKIGQSDAGSRAVASHTAALAGSTAAYRAMFERYGMVEGRDLEEMVDLASGFLAWPDRLPAGRRVGICTSSGGGGGWVADACAAAGLDVPEFDAETRAAIDVHLPSYGTSQNPVDVTAQGVHKIGYAAFARLLAASPRVDGVIIVITGRNARFLQADRERLRALAAETVKPVLMWSYTLPVETSTGILSETGFPWFTNVHHCARTLRAMADYRAARERLLAAEAAAAVPPLPPPPAGEGRGGGTHQAEAAVPGTVPPLPPPLAGEGRGGGVFAATPPMPPDAKSRVAAALAAAPPVLTEWEVRPLLAAYGIGAAETGTLALSALQAAAAAQALGRAVALKVQSPDIPHKTEAGAVALDVAPADAAEAYERVLAAARAFAPQARIDGVLVAPMAPKGREVILGVQRDATFGPMLLVGLGGVLVELIGDVALAPAPLRDAAEARALIARLKGARLLEAWRGQPPADVAALAETMLRLSRFAADHADAVAEIDLNPVLVHAAGEGVTVVDAWVVRFRRLG